MKYKTLLIDIDDTLLDFQKSEDIAIRMTLEKYGCEASDENVMMYKTINKNYWKKLERKEIEKEVLLLKRFEDLFNNLGVYGLDYKQVNTDYFEFLTSHPIEIEGAVDFLKKAGKHMEIYAITNAVTRVQEKRLSQVKITKHLKKIYISEAVGYPKPDKRFFDFVLNDLNITDKNEVVIMGDSLTSDIQGGINSNIDTIWYNPNQLNSDFKYTYNIKSYDDFFEIME